MFGFLKKKDTQTPAAKKFDPKVLRKNDISILILDERWNSLFTNMERPPEIVGDEQAIVELMKEEAHLVAERKELPMRKKQLLERIIGLTEAAHDRQEPEAIETMRVADAEVKKINERMETVEQDLDGMIDRIRNANLHLLGDAVNVIYLNIRKDQKRVEELEGLIEKTRLQLQAYIDEKETLNKDWTDVYTYFHDLLGPEELEHLDQEFFPPEGT